MNKLDIFTNEEFGQIRTLLIDNEVLFCASDIAKSLGYSNPNKAINDHCKGVTKRSTPTYGGLQDINYIKESDVYRLIVKSKLPKAVEFETWVFDEVLPTIRKTGEYTKTNKIERKKITLNGVEVFDKKEIAEILKIEQDTVRYRVKGSKLVEGLDFIKLLGNDLISFKVENPHLKSCLGQVVFSKQGKERLTNINYSEAVLEFIKINS